MVGRLRHKQASWSHCNINQSCSALPQTETPILDPSRPAETFLLCADRICLFVTTHTQVLGVGGGRKGVSLAHMDKFDISIMAVLTSIQARPVRRARSFVHARRSIGQIVWLARGISTPLFF